MNRPVKKSAIAVDAIQKLFQLQSHHMPMLHKEIFAERSLLCGQEYPSQPSIWNLEWNIELEMCVRNDRKHENKRFSMKTYELYRIASSV